MLPGERVRLHAAADTVQEAHATAGRLGALRTQPALPVLAGAP
jgi:hypothetical protein